MTFQQKERLPNKTKGDPVRFIQQPPPLLFLGLNAIVGSLLLLLGIWCFLYPGASGWLGIFWVGVGSALLGVAMLFLFQPHPKSVYELSQDGVGLVVGEIALPPSPFVCEECQQTKASPHFLRGSHVFCSWECEIAGREPEEDEERPLLLAPPLHLEQMRACLEKAIQLAERAILSASSKKLDKPLLRMTRQNQGARSLVLRVVASLLLWNHKDIALQLQEIPAPEPQMEGGCDGAPHFLQQARQLQKGLVELDFQNDPFSQLGLQHAILREELDEFFHTPLSPTQQSSLQTILETFDILEELDELEKPTLMMPSPKFRPSPTA